MFEDAISLAKIMDLEMRGGIKRGILHGIPISLKDQFKVKNTISTSGLAAYVNRSSSEDGDLA